MDGNLFYKQERINFVSFGKNRNSSTSKCFLVLSIGNNNLKEE
jgi:hypothetical protein